MLEITIPKQEYFDESCGEFVYVPEQHLTLEHSLVSLSKWESKWHKPFIQEESKTIEESLDYIRCMTINKNVNPLAYRCSRVGWAITTNVCLVSSERVSLNYMRHYSIRRSM